MGYLLWTFLKKNDRLISALHCICCQSLFSYFVFSPLAHGGNVDDEPLFCVYLAVQSCLLANCLNFAEWFRRNINDYRVTFTQQAPSIWHAFHFVVICFIVVISSFLLGYVITLPIFILGDVTDTGMFIFIPSTCHVTITTTTYKIIKSWT